MDDNDDKDYIPKGNSDTTGNIKLKQADYRWLRDSIEKTYKYYILYSREQAIERDRDLLFESQVFWFFSLMQYQVVFGRFASIWVNPARGPVRSGQAQEREGRQTGNQTQGERVLPGRGWRRSQVSWALEILAAQLIYTWEGMSTRPKL